MSGAVQFFLFGLFLAWFTGTGKLGALINAVREGPSNSGQNTSSGNGLIKGPLSTLPDISGVHIGGFAFGSQEHSGGVGQTPTVTSGQRGMEAIIGGSGIGSQIQVDWQFLQHHTGWIILENISGGPNPNFSITGPGAGTPSKSGQSDNSFVGTGGQSFLTLTSALAPGLYRLKLYLNDADYGTAVQKYFSVLANGSIVPASGPDA